MNFKIINRNSVRIFPTVNLLVDELANEFKNFVNNSVEVKNIALSGGTTPVRFFNKLSEEPYAEEIEWNKVNFFWNDERCVPPDSEESNYGAANKILFDKINISLYNIHRMRGEDNPQSEAERYCGELKKFVHLSNDLPALDWSLLGMGADGHTASLFPGKDLLFSFENITGVAEHPDTGQKRITLTRDLINNSKKITFVVTGVDKSETLKKLFYAEKHYPASEIKSNTGNVEWWLDKGAGILL